MRRLGSTMSQLASPPPPLPFPSLPSSSSPLSGLPVVVASVVVVAVVVVFVAVSSVSYSVCVCFVLFPVYRSVSCLLSVYCFRFLIMLSTSGSVKTLR